MTLPAQSNVPIAIAPEPEACFLQGGSLATHLGRTRSFLTYCTASLLISWIALGIVGVGFLGRVLVLEIAWLFLGFLFRYFGIHRLIHVSSLNPA